MASRYFEKSGDLLDKDAYDQTTWLVATAARTPFPAIDPALRAFMQSSQQPVDDLAASTILLPGAILDLDLQSEQTIALRTIMVSSRSIAKIEVGHRGGSRGCRRHCRIWL